LTNFISEQFQTKVASVQFVGTENKLLDLPKIIQVTRNALLI